MHLTNENLEQLLAGKTAPAIARELARHLEDPCPRCEALLAERSDPALEALADHPLTALAEERPEERGNDLEYARIQRALRAPPAPRRRWVPAAAAAAGLLVVGGIALRLAGDRRVAEPWDGVKGIAPALSVIPVRLSGVAVIAEPRSEQRVWRVAGGDSLPRAAMLQLRVEVGKPSHLALARLGADGVVDLFWEERAPIPGPITVTAAGRPAAYPLSDLTGPQRFVVIASAERLTPDRLRGALSTLGTQVGTGPPGSAVEGISFDVLSVTVR